MTFRFYSLYHPKLTNSFSQIVQLSTTDELDQISKNLSKKNKREAADKIQEMMDQLRDVHARLQAM